MTQQFLNNLRMRDTSEEVSCRGVSQVVDPHPRQACPVQRTVKPLDRPGTVDRPAHGCREDEADVLPIRSGCELVLNLPPTTCSSIANPVWRPVQRALPAQADVLDETGQPIGGVLVFLKDGYLSQLEVYSFAQEPIAEFPAIDRLRADLLGRSR